MKSEAPASTSGLELPKADTRKPDPFKDPESYSRPIPADRLALVIRAGAGTNTIDTAAAAAHGVLVSNVPGRNAAAVAELTMGLILAIDRRIADNVAEAAIAVCVAAMADEMSFVMATAVAVAAPLAVSV